MGKKGEGKGKVQRDEKRGGERREKREKREEREGRRGRERKGKGEKGGLERKEKVVGV